MAEKETIVTKMYDLVKYIIPVVNRFPRDYKCTRTEKETLVTKRSDKFKLTPRCFCITKSQLLHNGCPWGCSKSVNINKYITICSCGGYTGCLQTSKIGFFCQYIVVLFLI